MYTPHSDRRHPNPSCSCADCASFDYSVTLLMHHVPTQGVIMTAIDAETSERFTYSYHRGVLQNTSAKSAPSSGRRESQKKSEVKHSFRALLHELVIERIEKSVQAHPFFWLCISTLFR